MAMALVVMTLGIARVDLARRLKAGLSPAAAHLQAAASAADLQKLDESIF